MHPLPLRFTALLVPGRKCRYCLNTWLGFRVGDNATADLSADAGRVAGLKSVESAAAGMAVRATGGGAPTGIVPAVRPGATVCPQSDKPLI